MHKYFFAMLVMAAAALLSSEAWAATVRPIKTVSFKSLANSCKAAGGTSWGSAGGAYGCTKDNCDGKGGTCGVQCENGKCKGVTPTIVAGNANNVTVFDVLNPKPPKSATSRGPLGGGLLDTGGPGLGAGGPAATGSPSGGAAPAPRPQGGRIY